MADHDPGAPRRDVPPPPSADSLSNLEPAAPEPTSPLSAGSTVAKAGSIMVIALFMSRVLGLVRDTVLAAQFGINYNTDAYTIALQVPDAVFMLIAGGGLQNAFMPVFSDLWHRDRKAEAWRVFSSVATLTFLVSIVLVGGAALLNHSMIAFFGAEKPAETIREAERISLILLPMQIAFLTGSVLIATLYARKRYLGPALAPNLYNIGLIGGAALLPGLLGMGIEAMAWGGLVGAFVGNLVMPAIMMARDGATFRPSLDVSHPGVRKFFALLLPVILGFSLPSMANIITRTFAAHYPIEGSTTIMYGTANIMQAPLGIFGQALALAAFPVLAEFVAKDRMDLFRAQVSRTLSTVIFLGLFSGAILFALAPNIVHILLGYGEAARTPERLALMADILRWYAPGVVFWCMQPVLMRGFFSLHKTLEPVALGTVATAAFIGLGWGFGRLFPDLHWLAMASNIAAVILGGLLFFGLERKVGKLERARVLATLGKGTLAILPAIAIGYPVGRFAASSHRLTEIVLTTLVIILMGFIIQTVGKWLKMPETEYLDRAFARIRARAAR